MPIVSVLMPVYNAEEFIEEAVASILRQTLSDFELIIVCNGSNDATIEKVHAFTDSRIKVLHMKEPCIVEALNAGISVSNGKYIARMDADDISMPERFEKQVNFLETENDFDVVSCLVHFKGDRKENLGYALHVDWINSLQTYEAIFNERFVDSPVAHPSLLCRKTLFKKHGDYKKGDFPEDYELVLRWLDKGVKMSKIKEYLLHWRDHSGRLSRTHSIYQKDAFYRVKAKYLAHWFRQNPDVSQEVLVWGSGKSVRQKSQHLAEHGIHIAGYIDVRSAKQNYKPPVYHYSSFPEDNFVLSYVGDRTGKAEIKEFLLKKGLNFYMMA